MSNGQWIQEREPQGWNDFVRCLVAGEPQYEGRQRWRSTEYTASVTELEDGSLWISLSRHGTRGTVRSWRHLQAIKNKLAGPEREAVEIFPAESRLVDSADQYHLWVLPEGMTVGYGYRHRDVAGPSAAAKTGGRQAPFEPGTVPQEGADADTPIIPQDFVGPKPIFLAAQEQRVREAIDRG